MRSNTPAKLLLVSLFIACGCVVHTQKQSGDTVIAYPFANDSFLIRINNLASQAKRDDTIHVVYYVDQSIKSGKETDAIIAKYKSELVQHNYVFVGIGHFGYFRSKRRRDFITPSVKTEQGYKGVSADYGQADSFYSFLKYHIIPFAEEKLAGHPVKRSFIGHSLGGLFATYLLVNGDSLFTDLYALSPALWIDEYLILHYESSQQDRLRTLQKNFWLSCGSLETFNRIRNSVDQLSDTLSKRKYPGIHYQVKVYAGDTHNSSVGPTLDDIFSEFLNKK